MSHFDRESLGGRSSRYLLDSDRGLGRSQEDGGRWKRSERESVETALGPLAGVTTAAAPAQKALGPFAGGDAWTATTQRALGTLVRSERVILVRSRSSLTRTPADQTVPLPSVEARADRGTRRSSLAPLGLAPLGLALGTLGATRRVEW